MTPTYIVSGELWNPLPQSRRMQAETEEDAKVAFIKQVAEDFGWSEDRVRQHLHIERAERV